MLLGSSCNKDRGNDPHFCGNPPKPEGAIALTQLVANRGSEQPEKRLSVRNQRFAFRGKNVGLRDCCPVRRGKEKIDRHNDCVIP